MRRRRTITFEGRTLSRHEVLRFQVVRGVLLLELTLEEGARQLGMPMTELSMLVAGARMAVIRALGHTALEEARHAYRLAI
jgi:hypothetical protein